MHFGGDGSLRWQSELVGKVGESHGPQWFFLVNWLGEHEPGLAWKLFKLFSGPGVVLMVFVCSSRFICLASHVEKKAAGAPVQRAQEKSSPHNNDTILTRLRPKIEEGGEGISQRCLPAAVPTVPSARKPMVVEES